MVGTFGEAATYSFYPGKNLGAMGDAGAVVTNDAALAEHMTMLARHGGLVKHQHHIEGINSRLDGMQAAILSAKLPHLAAWTEARQAAAEVYDAGLNQIEDVVVPEVAPARSHVYHLYTIRHPRRDALAAHLNANGVQTAINYPTALPFLPAYARFGHRPEQFPNAPSRSGPDSLAADVRRDHTRAAGRGDRPGPEVLIASCASARLSFAAAEASGTAPDWRRGTGNPSGPPRAAASMSVG